MSTDAWGLLSPTGELLTFAAYEPDAFHTILGALMNLDTEEVAKVMKAYKPVRVTITVKGDENE